MRFFQLLVLASLLLIVGTAVPVFAATTAPTTILKHTAHNASGELHLRSVSGPFSLQSLHGKVVVLFFGYTHCPDVCPQDMSIIARAFNNIDATQQAHLKVVFVSLDPARDDVKTLQEFTRYFNPGFIGVTGSQRDIDKLAKRFGVHYKKVPVKGSADAYGIEHTASIYILDPSGNVGAILPSGISDLALQQAIQFLLDEMHS